MKIIIVGCGQVGRSLVRQLDEEGHDVSIIDTDPEKISNLTVIYDVMGFTGNGTSYKLLREAGIDRTDVLIAVTDSDEVNILCCIIARRSGCKTVARVRNPIYSEERSFMHNELGISLIINPDRSAAREVVRLLQFPSALKIESFAGGSIELIGFKVPDDSQLAGVSLRDSGLQKSGLLVCAAQRAGKTFIPHGDYTIEKGDIIAVITVTGKARKVLERIGVSRDKIKNAVIIGGGDLAYYIARMLERSGISTKLVEKDRSRCEILSEQLPETTVIHGDGLSGELYGEEHIGDADAIIAATDVDEENIIFSLSAAASSHAKVITKLGHMSYHGVIGSLNLDSIVNPLNIAADRILRFIRGLNNSIDASAVESLHRLWNGKVEALEFRVQPSCTLLDTKLMDMHIKRGTLIAAIIRSGALIIPGGTDSFEIGDSVIIVTTNTGCQMLDDIADA